MFESNVILQPIAIEKLADNQKTIYGVSIACLLLSLWAVSFGFLLHLNLAQVPVWFLPAVILWQMFLYTGLFITAHDAMHGSVCPNYPKVNHALGTLAVWCYGLFSYKELLRKHWLHHRYPASDRDPDFHDGEHSHPIRWYLCFMRRYWSWRRLIGLNLIFLGLHYFLGVSISNMLLFWFVPSVLSSVQLFYFGTYLTHQEPETGFDSIHRTQTTSLPFFWSFLTCYHFGYHHEHHEHPQVPWWQLPSLYKMRYSN